MNLTPEKLKSLYKNNYIKNGENSNRFDKMEQLFDDILKCKLEIDRANNEIKINDSILEYTDKNNIEVMPTIKFFGPAIDGMTQPAGYTGVKYMAERFKIHEELITQIGCLLGGFDFKNHSMIDKYRIISNGITVKDDFTKSLSTAGQYQHPSSHFADNTYFFNIMLFIQNSSENDIIEASNIVLRYPDNYFTCEGDDEHFTQQYQKQKEVLESRFPPKFLWMWANKHTVIHPISLMAFRNFLNTNYGKIILSNVSEDYTPKMITNMPFDEFKIAWQKISKKIIENLEIDNNPDNIQKLSKLISQISIEETNIKNISDLLTTGNKAVILWGPPGTGKTYESMKVVNELLNANNDSDFESKYLFSKNIDRIKEDQGYYEIVQFHPNYTYQDFIGGISPKLDDRDGTVSYELRHGVFKQFCDTAKNNKSEKYIFIIDEINRAELSAVFGELLFALEYRDKPINLPHFGEFTIPSNVHIIGTMNNVDKSLVTFDLALRRRFGFFKLMPKLEVLKDKLRELIKQNDKEKDDEEIVDTLIQYYGKCIGLNYNIEAELDLGENYKIGHAYFLKIKDFLDQEKIKNGEAQIITSFELEKLWDYNLEPLLEEYLGMNIEDGEMQIKLKNLKDEFLKDM